MKKYLVLISIFLLLVLVYFSIPKVNFIMSEQEKPIYDNMFNSFYKARKINKSIYPEVKNADIYLYSPHAALLASEDEIKPGSIAFDVTSPIMPFDISYTKDNFSKYSEVYALDNLAIVYDYNNEEFIQAKPENIASFGYYDEISEVGAAKLEKELSSFTYVLIYEVEKTMELIPLIEDKLIVPYIYSFESFSPYAYVEIDKEELLKKRIEGTYLTPYKLTINSK